AVVSAWANARARFGWMDFDEWARVDFKTAVPTGKAGVPAFHFWARKLEPGLLKQLPQPGAPFGLAFSWGWVTNEGISELANFPDLRVLSFYSAGLTADNLTELGKLKQLHTLDVRGTKTCGNLKDLADLKNLRALDISYADVNDAGLKDLAGLQQLKLL